MEITNQNIEKLFFLNKLILDLFPEYKQLYNQWLLGHRVPALNKLCKKSCLELLEKLSLKIDILEDYFKEKVEVMAVNYHIVRNEEANKDSLENWLKNDNNFKDYFCISRNEDKVRITFWR